MATIKVCDQCKKTADQIAPAKMATIAVGIPGDPPQSGKPANGGASARADVCSQACASGWLAASWPKPAPKSP